MRRPGRVGQAHVQHIPTDRSRPGRAQPVVREGPELRAGDRAGHVGEVAIDLVEQVAPEGGNRGRTGEKQGGCDEDEEQPDEAGAQGRCLHASRQTAGHQDPRGTRST